MWLVDNVFVLSQPFPLLNYRMHTILKGAYILRHTSHRFPKKQAPLNSTPTERLLCLRFHTATVPRLLGCKFDCSSSSSNENLGSVWGLCVFVSPFLVKVQITDLPPGLVIIVISIVILRCVCSRDPIQREKERWENNSMAVASGHRLEYVCGGP